jgi:4-amino-4-deoxy-L-arabinose transferase-like glycosyltransferase
MSNRAALAAAGAVALIALVVYSLTVQRSMPAGDGGELIAAAYALGVAHPPGYPLYTLLGHAATMLPGGSPALSMNLLSAFLDSLAVGVVFILVLRLVAADRATRRLLPIVAAATGALLLAFSSVFWAYSVVAEVFALNNLFAALLLLIGIEWSRRPERMWLAWLFMFAAGLAFCNQQTIVLFLPAFAVLAWQGWRRLPPSRGPLRLTVRQLGVAVLAFVAGLLPYLYLPLAASSDPPVNWGDPVTIHRFYTDVSRGNYGTTTLVAGGEAGSVWQNLRLLDSSLAHGFVYAGILLALGGLWWTWRNRRAEGLALLAAFIVSGPVFQAYSNTSYPSELTKGIVARFYVLPSVPLAILSGLGAWWVLIQAERVHRTSRRALVTALAAGGLLAVPAAAAAGHYSSSDQSGNRVALNYGRDLLGPLAPDSLLVMRGDENYTSVTYAQVVDHFRPDVIAVDAELLKLPSYVAGLRREHPSVVIPFAAYDGGARTSLNTLVAANLPEHPVYAVGPEEERGFGKPFDQVYAGLADRLLPQGSAPDPFSLLAGDPARFERLHYPSRRYPASSWEGGPIGRAYATAAFELAYVLDNRTQAGVAPSERMYRTAIRLDPTLAGPYKNLGILLYRHGGDRNEIMSLWTTFLRLDPADSQASQLEAVLAKLRAGESGTGS